MLRIRQQTISQFLSRWREAGKNLASVEIRKRRPRKQIKDEATEKYLVSEKGLKSMSGLSLRKRCGLLKLRYNHKLSPASLLKFYWRHNVRWRAVGY